MRVLRAFLCVHSLSMRHRGFEPRRVELYIYFLPSGWNFNTRVKFLDRRRAWDLGSINLLDTFNLYTNNFLPRPDKMYELTTQFFLLHILVARVNLFHFAQIAIRDLFHFFFMPHYFTLEGCAVWKLNLHTFEIRLYFYRFLIICRFLSMQLCFGREKDK